MSFYIPDDFFLKSHADHGDFGQYGGRYVPEAMLPALDEIAKAYDFCRAQPSFTQEFFYYLKQYSGRPTPLFYCNNLTNKLGGAKIYLKREDLNHLGAHKINNTIGQILIAKKMGKKKIIAETGAGQHGVAAAATAALMGMECKVFMGELDVERQKLNVFRMRLMGAEVVVAKSGQRGLKEAVDEALEFWIQNPDTFYIIGSAVGPHPYPVMVRDFQSVIGIETRAQSLEIEKRLPDACLACVGGGSNAIGMFHPFINDREVRLIGVEPAGRSLDYGENAATLCLGEPGVLHGYKSYVLKNDKGETAEVYSLSPGLDYPGVGPEHSYLKDAGRAEYVSILDSEALDAFSLLSRSEGILPALESAHAVAHAIKLAPQMSKDQFIVVNLSGRGDKDVEELSKLIKVKS